MKKFLIVLLALFAGSSVQAHVLFANMELQEDFALYPYKLPR